MATCCRVEAGDGAKTPCGASTEACPQATARCTGCDVCPAIGQQQRGSSVVQKREKMEYLEYLPVITLIRLNPI